MRAFFLGPGCSPLSYWGLGSQGTVHRGTEWSELACGLCHANTQTINKIRFVRMGPENAPLASPNCYGWSQDFVFWQFWWLYQYKFKVFNNLLFVKTKRHLFLEQNGTSEVTWFHLLLVPSHFHICFSTQFWIPFKLISKERLKPLENHPIHKKLEKWFFL